jgi:hypothetical protein
MADSKKKKKTDDDESLKTQDQQKAPADTDNFPPPEFLAKPAPGDTGYNIVAAAYHDQTDYFRPGIRSNNHEISRERNTKEKPRRVYEHVYTFEEFLSESETVNESNDITSDSLLDWINSKIAGKTVDIEKDIEDYAKSKGLEPEDLNKLVIHILTSEMGWVGKGEPNPEQSLLIDLVRKMDKIYGMKSEI